MAKYVTEMKLLLGMPPAQILREPIVEKDQEDFQQLVSSTNFHQVKHSNFEQPLKITELTLPIPNDYSFSSNVLTYVLLRPGEHGDNYNPSIWNIIDRNPKIRKHKIYVPLDHFGHVQCVQYQFQTTDSVIKEETEQRYQSALRAKSQARFLALVKSLNKENKAEVIIECTSDFNFKRRIEYWESRGYTDQNPSHSLPFQVCSAQTFTLDITGGLRKKTSAEIQLEFHPKRKKNNIREILIEPSVKDDKNIKLHGKFEIHRLTEDKKRSKLHSTKGPRHLELLDFIKLHINHQEIDLAKTINFAGFTCDSLMIDIHDRLNAEERRKLLVHLRIDFNKNMTDGDIKQSFLEWGHMVIKHRDLGVTNLILSLTEVNEKQAIRVLKDLKKWKAANKKIRTAFTAWLDDLKPDNNIDVKKVRRPLSDDYFKALAHILVTNDNKITPHDLFTRLSLPDAAVENVTKNHLFRKPIIQFYTLLKKYRSGWNSEIQCLKKLQAVLSSDKLKIKGAADWADRMAKNWINSESVHKSDEFYQKLKEYLSPGSNESSDSDD